MTHRNELGDRRPYRTQDSSWCAKSEQRDRAHAVGEIDPADFFSLVLRETGARTITALGRQPQIGDVERTAEQRSIGALELSVFDELDHCHEQPAGQLVNDTAFYADLFDSLSRLFQEIVVELDAPSLIRRSAS